MNDIGPFQDIVNVSWRSSPALIIIRLLSPLFNPITMQVSESPLNQTEAPSTSLWMSGHVRTHVGDAVISLAQEGAGVPEIIVDRRQIAGIGIGATTGFFAKPNWQSLWLDMPALRSVIGAEHAFDVDLYGYFTNAVDDWQWDVTIEVESYISAPGETAFVKLEETLVNGLETGRMIAGKAREETTVRQTTGFAERIASGTSISQPVLMRTITIDPRSPDVRFDNDPDEEEE
jgi:hypothetical protein